MGEDGWLEELGTEGVLLVVVGVPHSAQVSEEEEWLLLLLLLDFLV